VLGLGLRTFKVRVIAGYSVSGRVVLVISIIVLF